MPRLGASASAFARSLRARLIAARADCGLKSLVVQYPVVSPIARSHGSGRRPEDTDREERLRGLRVGQILDTLTAFAARRKLRSMNEGKRSNTLLDLGRALYHEAKDYVVNSWVRDELAGLNTLKVPLRGGRLYWPGLVMLLLAVVAGPYFRLAGQGYPVVAAEIYEGEVLGAPLPALYLALLVFSFAWAYLLTGAAGYGLGVYVLAAAYAAYFGLLAGLSLAGTLWFALVPIWLLLLGGWVASLRPAPSAWLRTGSGQASRLTWLRLPLLALLSWLVALMTYPSLGLSALLPGPWGRVALTALYFALVANPLVRRKAPSFKPSIAFGVTLVLFVSLYALSLQRSTADEVFGWAFLSFHSLLGLVSLFWIWLGLDLFNGAQDIAERVAGIVETLMPPKALAATIFSLWVLWSAIAYLLTHGPGLGLTTFLSKYGWGQTLLEGYLLLNPSPVLAFSLDYSLYLTIAICLFALGLRLTKRLSSERVMSLFNLSLFGFIVLYGFFGVMFAIGSEDWESTLGAWPLLIFVAGMFWQIPKAASGLVSGTKIQTSVFLGLLLAFGAISLLELTAGYSLFYKELSLNPLLGVLYLGLPYLLYTFLYQQRRRAPVSSGRLMLLFALGMLSALPALAWGTILIAPVVWLALILATVWRWGRWDGYLDGAIYTSVLALGFVAFYTHPVIIPIPAFTAFLGRFVELQGQYAGDVIWPWEARWWWLLLAALGAAAILGCVLSRARLAKGRRQNYNADHELHE